MPIRKPIPWTLPRQEGCICGCTDHDQCRQDAMARARDEAWHNSPNVVEPPVMEFLRREALKKTQDHPTGPPTVCDCTICTNVRDVREAALRLAYALSAHACEAVTKFKQERLIEESRTWKTWAESLHIDHQRKGGA